MLHCGLQQQNCFDKNSNSSMAGRVSTKTPTKFQEQLQMATVMFDIEKVIKYRSPCIIRHSHMEMKQWQKLRNTTEIGKTALS